MRLSGKLALVVIAAAAMMVVPAAVLNAPAAGAVTRPSPAWVPGSLPAIRVGIVAMTFVNADDGFGVYEPFAPSRPVPAPRLATTTDGGADWFLCGPTPPAPRTVRELETHRLFESVEWAEVVGGRVSSASTEGDSLWAVVGRGTSTMVEHSLGASEHWRRVCWCCRVRALSEPSQHRQRRW